MYVNKNNFYSASTQHMYINGVTTIIRNFVNGDIDEKTYRTALHEIFDTYRKDKRRSCY